MFAKCLFILYKHLAYDRDIRITRRAAAMIVMKNAMAFC
jgi:hypothetical protein